MMFVSVATAELSALTYFVGGNGPLSAAFKPNHALITDF
jgi:hypothetical protein